MPRDRHNARRRGRETRENGDKTISAQSGGARVGEGGAHSNLLHQFSSGSGSGGDAILSEAARAGAGTIQCRLFSASTFGNMRRPSCEPSSLVSFLVWKTSII